MSTESKKSKKSAFDEMMQDSGAVYQLGEGLTAEEMLPIFFNENALVEQPQMIYRINGGANRYYYTFDEKQDPVFYTSVTTMIKFTMPTSPHLIKWIADMGHDASKLYAQDRADYGTFMHAEIAELLITRRYDITKLRDKLKAYIEKEKLPASFINYEDELKKDMLSFAQFMIDYNVRPLAVEVVLAHPTDGYAGAIDLVCIMTVKVDGLDHENPYKTGKRKGEPREVKVDKDITAIIDFKSGRKGFYEEHEIQLQAYKNMWQHHFPNKPVEKVFNWSPNAWRGITPTYKLKDQTDSKSLAKLQYLVELSRIENSRKDNTVTLVEGYIDLSKGLSSNVSEISLEQLVKKRKTEKQKPLK